MDESFEKAILALLIVLLVFTMVMAISETVKNVSCESDCVTLTEEERDALNSLIILNTMTTVRTTLLIHSIFP